MNLSHVVNDPENPSFFTVTVYWIGGGETSFDFAELNYVERLTDKKGNVLTNNFDTYRGWTKDNEFIEIPKGSYKYIHYRKNYTKIVERFNKENGITR